MTATATAIAQLRVLAQLVRAQGQAARLRLAQTTDTDVRDGLRRTADEADGHGARIADVLHDLGALPDPVSPVLGRVAALMRSTVEQAQPLDEALLADLALEHLLHDRARYVAALADAGGLAAVRVLADDLDAAHAGRVGWLHEVLADLARGRTAAVDPSLLQRVAAQVSRAANAPRRAVPDEPDTPPSDTEPAPTSDSEPAPTADDGPEPAIDAVDPDPDPEPSAGPAVPGFAELPAHAAIAALRSVDDPREVDALLAVEQEHGNRPGVLAAARIRAGSLGRGQ